ncbi:MULTISPECIES: amino acid ABC transporter permease [Nitratireductor]|uniref:amino acid ABC transporter permease n=1 Tax=Nitratireductor TaxID=245876 RepID=UPI000D0D28E3|nr:MULTISPECIES: amino acid ABC transporter permease [Nitratireductor]PSM20240.1 ABC transporter permease [Nitratireductor sp. StC3]
MMFALEEQVEEKRSPWGLVAVMATLALIGVAAWKYVNWQLLASLDFSVVWDYRLALAKGLMVTLYLTAIAGLCGLTAGTVLAALSQSRLALVRWVVVAYVELFRNTPILVQLIWIHFALPVFTGWNTTALQSGTIAIALQASAYFSEIVRGGIESVPKGQWEAAYALGLPARTTWGRVILPPALKSMIPALVNLTISFFKATSILSVLQVSELMTITNRISNAVYKPIELFTAAAVIYFVLGYILSQLTLRLERAAK